MHLGVPINSDSWLLHKCFFEGDLNSAFYSDAYTILHPFFQQTL